jgi:hypothetical protein
VICHIKRLALPDVPKHASCVSKVVGGGLLDQNPRSREGLSDLSAGRSVSRRGRRNYHEIWIVMVASLSHRLIDRQRPRPELQAKLSSNVYTSSNLNAGDLLQDSQMCSGHSSETNYGDLTRACGHVVVALAKGSAPG